MKRLLSTLFFGVLLTGCVSSGGKMTSMPLKVYGAALYNPPAKGRPDLVRGDLAQGLSVWTVLTPEDVLLRFFERQVALINIAKPIETLTVQIFNDGAYLKFSYTNWRKTQVGMDGEAICFAAEDTLCLVFKERGDDLVAVDSATSRTYLVTSVNYILTEDLAKMLAGRMVGDPGTTVLMPADTLGPDHPVWREAAYRQYRSATAKSPHGAYAVSPSFGLGWVVGAWTPELAADAAIWKCRARRKAGDLDCATISIDGIPVTLTAPVALDVLYGPKVAVNEMPVTLNVPTMLKDRLFQRFNVTENSSVAVSPSGAFFAQTGAATRSNADYVLRQCRSRLDRGHFDCVLAVENGQWKLPPTVTLTRTLQ